MTYTNCCEKADLLELAHSISSAQPVNVSEPAPAEMPTGAVWKLPTEQRIKKATTWHSAFKRNAEIKLKCARLRYDQLDAELTELQTVVDRKVLAGVRVIGATTTGAAKYRSLIQGVGAGVVLMEEAGEILEARVLSTLGDSTKHIILIGDHKQLRPKVETHGLTVAAQNGYDLNRSLFERLILGGLSHRTLELQHRMRPEISAIARRMTYPELRDAATVAGRPNLLGFATNVVFIDHRVLEQGETEELLGHRSLSKINQHEAKMTIQIVRYSLLNGYNPEQVVVLTPYLGQLRLLQQGLQDLQISSVIGDADAEELTRLGIEQPWEENVSQKSQSVRVSTIDNYQGEEADVIIVSLVRSNSRGQLGFLGKADAEQRVNVLCTRARVGLVLIGNAQCLEQNSALWRRLLGYLRGTQVVFDGLPIKCQRHGSELNPAHFCTPKQLEDALATGAGCGNPCDAVLDCGHPCPLKCHPWGHKKVKCDRVVRVPCAAGLHHVDRACASRRPPKCRHAVIEHCCNGHILVRDCSSHQKPCQVCKVVEQGERDLLRALEEAQVEHTKRVESIVASFAEQVNSETSQQIEGAHGEAVVPSSEVPEGAHGELAALQEEFENCKTEIEAKVGERLERAKRDSQAVVTDALGQMAARHEEDEARLLARHQDTERELELITKRIEQQRSEAQHAGEARLQERERKLQDLHAALSENLQANTDALDKASIYWRTHSQVQLVECPPDSLIFGLAAALLQNTWFKKETYELVKVIRVTHIINQHLGRAYQAYKDLVSVGGVVNGNETLVFHGCTEIAMDLDNPNSIIRTGFLKKYWKSSAGEWQRFGPGF